MYPEKVLKILKDQALNENEREISNSGVRLTVNERKVFDSLKTPQIMGDVHLLTDLSYATCHRILNILLERGLIVKEGKKWKRAEPYCIVEYDEHGRARFKS